MLLLAIRIPDNQRSLALLHLLLVDGADADGNLIPASDTKNPSSVKKSGTTNGNGIEYG